MQIVIIRHGEPTACSNKAISAFEFSDWIEEYNQSGLIENARPSQAVFDICLDAKLIVCSTLKRSQESAQIIAGNTPIESNEKLVEAGMPYADWTAFKLQPKYWSLVFRLLWLMGFSKNSESFQEAKKRAQSAAEHLEEKSER